MDSNIKTLLSCSLFLLLHISCSFDDVHLYEIKINNWASISYNIINGNDSTSFSSFELYACSDKKLKIDRRIELNSSDNLRKREILAQFCTKIIYNDSIIFILNGIDNDTTNSLYSYNEYYKIIPRPAKDNRDQINFEKEILSDRQFYSLIDNCKNCKVIDIDRLRKIK